MKFNYQVVFSCNEDDQVVFLGKTRMTPFNLYLALAKKVDSYEKDVKCTCVNFIYQPIKNLENETSKEK